MPNQRRQGGTIPAGKGRNASRALQIMAQKMMVAKNQAMSTRDQIGPMRKSKPFSQYGPRFGRAGGGGGVGRKGGTVLKPTRERTTIEGDPISRDRYGTPAQRARFQAQAQSIKSVRNVRRRRYAA